MKNKTKIKGLITLMVITLQSQILFAQWQVGNASGQNYYRPDAALNIIGAGIGDFPNGTPPLSALHINTNPPFPGNGFWNAGEVFRTESPDITAYWRMYKFDNNQGQSFEYGKIFSADAIDDPTGLAENFHFYIASSFADDLNQQFGEIRFNTPTDQWNVNTNRMRIMGGREGFVGIGDYAVFTPQSVLHQHSGSSNSGGGSPSNYHQFTNTQTGPNAGDGLKIGIADQIAIFNNQEDFPIYFYTNNQIRMAVTKRVVNGIEGAGVGISSLGIQPITEPKSLLHLGDNYLFGAAFLGWRPWMNTGTFAAERSDLVYFGEMMRDGNIASSNPDIDAVIAWGDNEAHTPFEADYLRIIFTGVYGNVAGNAGGLSGLEVARYTPDGMCGIGNFTSPIAGGGSGFQPVRRLEIYDEHLDPFINNAAPQLRLTYAPNAFINLGTHTDFQNTSIGNLIIVTENAGVIANTGIGNFHSIGSTIEPKRRLDILDQGTDLPQLRLTYTADAATANGIWTDFQTTEKGDLYIHPYGITSPTNSTPINRRVGINTSTPGSTLEINSIVTAVYPGLSGLQFHDLTTASQIYPSAFTGAVKGVLSVDVDGKVILVADENGTPSNAVTACVSGMVTPNYITKVTGTKEICESSIWENSSSDKSVGIGITSPSSTNKVTIYKASSTNSTGLSLTNDMTSGASSGTSIGIDLLTKGIGSAAVVKGIKNRVYGGVQVWGMECNVYDGTSFNIGGAFTCNGPTGSTNTGVSVAMNGGTCTGIAASINNTITTTAVNVGANLSVSSDGTNDAIVATAVPNTAGSSTNNRGVDVNVGHNTFTAVTNTGIDIYTQNANNNTGITMQVMPTSTTTTNNTGIECKVGASTTSSSNNTKGIYVYARGGSGINYGVEAAAGTVPNTLGASNVGGKFEATGGSTYTYGVYVTTSAGGCSASSSSSCTTAAGFFNGDLANNASFYPSDIHLKTNIQNVSNGLSIINQLQPKTYNYDTAQYSFMNLHGDLQYGLVAQDLIPVLPQCLKNLGLPQESDSTGKIIHPEVNYLGVNYTMIIPILIAGMKEQQLQIDSLINALAAANQPKMANPNTIEVTLSNQNKIILNQNDPNPFAENTTINYFIPDNVNAAQLLFYDNSGTILKTVDIKEKGQGSILIYGSNLSSGVYTYTLLADGKPIETKRMVKIK
jgi:hypothetical protein